MTDLTQYERIHIVGIGGAGMSALAKVLAARGYDVSGSDLRDSVGLADLADLGIAVWPGHRPERVSSVDLVVASSAVPDRDSELLAALESDVPVWRRPQLLDAMTAVIPTIGATGTHGKTSSTGMLISAIKGTGMDPSFIIGGELVEYRTNAMVGRDDLLVLEVDEAFGTFEHVHLDGLMVTNVEADHLDHFGTVEELERAFVRVVTAVDGPVVVCTDDPGGARLAVKTHVVTYGMSPAPSSPVQALDRFPSDPVPGSTHWQVAIDRPGFFSISNGVRSADVRAPRQGLHMMLNAAGVMVLMAELGYDLSSAAAGVAGYQGVSRRFERKGTVHGVSLLDDYAHHPTEIAATLSEARLMTEGKLVAVFQPHLYSRTEQLKDEFGRALSLADRIFVTDVYGSREAPRPGVTGQLVVDTTVAAGGKDVRYIQRMTEIPTALAASCAGGDVIVLLGAGDITVLAPDVLRALDERGEG